MERLDILLTCANLLSRHAGVVLSGQLILLVCPTITYDVLALAIKIIPNKKRRTLYFLGIGDSGGLLTS